MQQIICPPTVVDLFCGCGAVTDGLVRKGLKVVAAVDCDSIACQTYRQNHPDVHLYETNIEKLTPIKIRLEDLDNKDVDLMVVCAPCQPFSSQNRNKDGDKRANLILQTIRFTKVLRPRIIFFENVPGLASPRYFKIIQKLKKGLTDEGYRLSDPVCLDAADYGVPQRRLRCVMFAASDGNLPELPAPITPEGQRNTLKSMIDDLPPLISGQVSENDPLHFARIHRSIALERMRHIPKDGGDRFSLPPELELLCHKEHKGHPDVYGRMWWNQVAPTLTTGCTDITRGRFMHPRDDRAISLREAARLQTFRDSYDFFGSAKDIAKQIGNAVPVGLVEALAPAIIRAMTSDQNGERR